MRLNSDIKDMKRTIHLMLIQMMLASCISEQSLTPERQENITEESFPITVEVEAPTSIGCTRSSYSDEQLNKIYDINIFIYHNGNLLEEYCRYFTDISAITLTLPYKKDGFNIYMVGNVNRMEPPSKEADIEKFCCIADDYENFRNNGFPVAGSFLGHMKGSLANFKVKRLVGQYSIQMKTTANDAIYTIKDVRLYNCAKDIYPFCATARATVMASEGDRLTDEDILALNAGKTVHLYFIENMQGVLLPDNKNKKKKIPSSIELIESGLADRCTYIEITADISTPAASYRDGKYRFYLGQNETTDFNIKRNTLYNVTLDFTQNMVNEEEWRIEVNSPEVVDIKMDKDEAMVIKGAEDMIYIQAFSQTTGNLLDFNIDILSSNNYINVDKIRTDYLGESQYGEALGLRFTSNVDICGLYPLYSEPTYKTETVHIYSKETYNGTPLYSKEIKVKVYDRLFPLLIKLEKFEGTASNPYEIVLRGQNPMRLGLSVSGKYVAGGVAMNLSEYRKYDYIYNGERISRAVDMNGSTFDNLRNVTTDNLSRIDLVVKGIAEETGKVIAYPRLTASASIFMGSDTEAYYGPGSSLRPGNMPNLPADGRFVMTYIDDSGARCTIDSKYDGVMRTDLFKWTYTHVTNNSSTMYFGTEATGIGVSKSGFIPNVSHEDCPFYFVNGGLEAYYVDPVLRGNLVVYPKENNSHIDVRFWGPGRDLFKETEGVEEYQLHRMYYQVTRWKNLIGKIKTRQDAKYYNCKLYMTINGASSWVGGDTSKNGYFTEEY